MVSFLSSTFSVFLSVLCDNLLLTVVVPILPEILREEETTQVHDDGDSGGVGTGYVTLANSTAKAVIPTAAAAVLAAGNNIDESCLKQLFHLRMLNENSQLGILFSTKAIMQLVCNPLVGNLTLKIGYKVPLCIGNFILFVCSLIFGFADSYLLFLIGRSFHGLASSLITISGMALVAELYQYDKDRTIFLGRVMGAAALGVLIGYPFGGFFYAFVGKTIPFVMIALLALFSAGLQLSSIHLEWMNHGDCFRPKLSTPACVLPTSSVWTLLRDRSILIIAIAIWLSTMAMAVLEPTLPVWLIESIDPPKWQLGLVFVPDSVGYFTGTNFFGQFALNFGRWKTSMMSMAAIGAACFVLPLSSQVWQLALPHFVLGLGLGIVDASLMPLLAKLADESYHAGYGAVYALAQTSVALAYSSGPLIGGQLVPLVGFPDLMRIIGCINVMFCPFLLFLYESHDHEEGNGMPIIRPQHSLLPVDNGMMQMTTVRSKLIQADQPWKTNSALYQRFYNDDLEWD